MVEMTVKKLFLILLFICIGSQNLLVSLAEGKKKQLATTEESKNVLLCLPNFFELVFKPSFQNVTEDQELKRAEALFQNSICIGKSVNTGPNLVQCFANLFDSLAKLSPGIEMKEETRIKEDLNKNMICISNEVHNDSDVYLHIREIITSFTESNQHIENVTDNEVSQAMSKILLNKLAYHFTSSYKKYPLPATIKEQDKLSQHYIQSNAGSIVVSLKSTEKMLHCLAEIFNEVFNISQQVEIESNDTSELHDTATELHDTAKCVVDHFGENIGLNTYIHVNRAIQSFVQKIQDPEPKEPKIKISKAIFDGVQVLIAEPIKLRRAARPALVYIHGGGWVYRTPEKYLPQTVYLAKELGAVVVSVDYRRSPEYVFPDPVNDCLKVTKYLMANTQNYTVDPKRIGIIGDSAGGNMAAVVSLMLRDENIKLKTQILIYPCLQMFDLNLPSYQQNERMIGLGKDEMIDFYLLYANLSMSYKSVILNNQHICEDMENSTYSTYIDTKPIPKKYRRDYVQTKTACNPVVAAAIKDSMLNSYMFPLMSKNLKDLPPTLIINNEFDILRDEGLLFGVRLKKAGNTVKEHVIEGGYHGSFDMLNHLTIGQDVMDLIMKYLKNKL